MKCGSELFSHMKAPYHYHFDAIVTGEDGVGKSTFLEKFVSMDGVAHRKPAEGVYSLIFDLKEVELGVTFTETPSAAVKPEAEFAAAAVLFDLTNGPSFVKGIRLVRMLTGIKQKKVIYLIGNKLDLVRERKISTQDGLNTAAQLGCGYFEVSAVTADGLSAFRQRLIRDLLLLRLEILKKGLAKDE